MGIVKDPSGATVTGAQVTLRNSDIGLSRKITTDSAGSFEFLAVPVGEHYAVDVEAAGFQKASQPEIKLVVNQRYRADFTLAVGTLTANAVSRIERASKAVAQA